MEKSYPATIKVVQYICDKCKKGFMKPLDYALPSNPPQYPHACNNCGHRDTYKGIYPYQIFMPINKPGDSVKKKGQ